MDLSPQVIVGGSAFECVLGTVFLEHALEDHHVAGSHINDFKPYVIGVGIYVIMMAPFAAGHKRHGILIGNVSSELDLHPKVLAGWDFFWAVQPKSPHTDICDVPDQFFADIVIYWHVICKVTTSNFSFVSHGVAPSFSLPISI
jgi:hypothetical protein